MANATPDEKAELEKIADKMRARAAVAAPATPTTNYGTTGYAPQSPAAASPWVTAEPEVAIPDTSGLTPEQRREQAREKARAAATTQAQNELNTNANTWAERQAYTERLFSGESTATNEKERQMEEDGRVVATASVVLTAFVVAEAEARGFKTQP
jgi:hypothetical protein